MTQRFNDSVLPDKSGMPRVNMRSPKINRYIEAAYNDAHEAFERGDTDTALQKYYWIIQKMPYDSTAFLQRSAVYEHLGRFDDAIADCDAVIAMSNQSDSLAEAHMVRGVSMMRKQRYNEAIASFDQSLLMVENDTVYNLKKKCETLANPDTLVVPTYDDDYQFFNFLSQEMNGMAQIKMSNIHGRGIFATRDIAAEEMLFETRSVVSTSAKDVHDDIENEAEISKSREFARLSQTISRMTRLPVQRILPDDCGKCHKVLYCSPECKADGQDKHIAICASDSVQHRFVDVFEREIDALTEHEQISYMLLLKLIASQFPNGDQSSPIRSLELDDVVKRLVHAVPLKSNFTLSRKDNKIFRVIKDMLHDRRITPELYYRFKSIVFLNQNILFTSKINVKCTPAPMDELGYNFDFDDKPSKPILTIPLHLAFMNHSCSPNVFIASPIVNDKQIRIVSKRPIKKGEELFISYITGQNIDTDKRNEQLHEAYGFQCKCRLCLSNTTIPYLTKIE
eukprot:gene11507-13425_t